MREDPDIRSWLHVRIVYYFNLAKKTRRGILCRIGEIEDSGFVFFLVIIGADRAAVDLVPRSMMWTLRAKRMMNVIAKGAIHANATKNF
jgi:hypothetical protein